MRTCSRHIHPADFLTSSVSDGNYQVTSMDNDNEPYLDKNGEPLVDFDKNAGAQGNEQQKHALKSICKESKSSPTPVCNDVNSRGRTLVIKIKPSAETGPLDFGLNGDGVLGSVRDDKKGKKVKGESRRNLGKKSNADKGETKSRVTKKGSRRLKDHDAHSEVNEMWDTILGGNSKDDRDGVRTLTKDVFVYDSDGEHSPSRASKAKGGEVDGQIEELFKFGKKKKKEPTSSEITSVVDSVIAQLDAAAQKDAELNRRQKPAITKLRNLSLLDIITRKHLQKEFLDSGVLTSLRGWLEPLPDGSIINIDTRGAVFKCLNDLAIDLGQCDQRQKLKDSGIGKAVMFYYKLPEETTANRKVAKELVDKWSRAIFEISTRYEDTKEDKRTYQAPPVKKAMSSAVAEKPWDHDLPELSEGRKFESSSSKKHASRPEAVPMDFAVRPQSKVDPEAVGGRTKQNDQTRARLNKKMQQLSARNSKQLQAVKPSVEGRGMVKYV